jgi:Rieske 2Fe-2S family protein
LKDLTTGNASVTGSGRACAPLISNQLTDADRRRAYYYSVLPNMMLSVHSDYVIYYLVTPLAPDRTRVESEWLFAPGPNTVGDEDDAVAFWDQVNRQDWDIIERSQQGIASRRYEPGPYSPRESISAAWDREYVRLIAESSTERP